MVQGAKYPGRQTQAVPTSEPAGDQAKSGHTWLAFPPGQKERSLLTTYWSESTIIEMIVVEWPSLNFRLQGGLIFT